MGDATMKRRPAPAFEPLESRDAPAVGVTADAGLLNVQGSAADTIQVAHVGPNFEVHDAATLIAVVPDSLVQRVRDAHIVPGRRRRPLFRRPAPMPVDRNRHGSALWTGSPS